MTFSVYVSLSCRFLRVFVPCFVHRCFLVMRMDEIEYWMLHSPILHSMDLRAV